MKRLPRYYLRGNWKLYADRLAAAEQVGKTFHIDYVRFYVDQVYCVNGERWYP